MTIANPDLLAFFLTIAVAPSIPVTAFALTMVLKRVIPLPDDLAAGLFTGAMTSTPGLA